MAITGAVLAFTTNWPAKPAEPRAKSARVEPWFTAGGMGIRGEL
jgi:hypothetical protein